MMGKVQEDKMMETKVLTCQREVRIAADFESREALTQLPLVVGLVTAGPTTYILEKIDER